MDAIYEWLADEYNISEQDAKVLFHSTCNILYLYSQMSEEDKQKTGFYEGRLPTAEEAIRYAFPEFFKKNSAK